MHHSPYSGSAGFNHHCARIVFCITGMYDDREARFARKRKLCGECASLLQARRIVVVIVEPAFPDSHSARFHILAQQRRVVQFVETTGVVGMHTGGKPDEGGMGARQIPRRASGAEDIPGAAAGADADDCSCSALTRPPDYIAAVALERGVCEVRVAVDER